jgi:hypothetical protein
MSKAKEVLNLLENISTSISVGDFVFRGNTFVYVTRINSERLCSGVFAYSDGTRKAFLHYFEENPTYLIIKEDQIPDKILKKIISKVEEYTDYPVTEETGKEVFDSSWKSGKGKRYR